MKAQPRQTCLALAVAGYFLCGATSPSFAQVTSGSVSGSVRDTQGAVVPTAAVTLASPARGTAMETTSNENGDFVFPNVSADTYVLRVVMDGFKTVERQGMMVSPGDRVALGIVTIDIGAVTETVRAEQHAGRERAAGGFAPAYPGPGCSSDPYTDPTPTNLPYDAAGNFVNPTGFGAVTNVRPSRQVQLLARFQF